MKQCYPDFKGISMQLNLPTDRFQLLEITKQDPQKVLEQDVREGLLTAPRSLPPKYFYDDVGSQLFSKICETEDYYPTRTEHDLLKRYAVDIITVAHPKTLIELGAGTSVKSEILLSSLAAQLNACTYITIDVCKEILIQSAERLLTAHPKIRIKSLIGEYLPAIQITPTHDKPALYIFIGSSIGNFDEADAINLLTKLSQKMNAEDYFLLGVDRVKDKTVLERAYDDHDGVTAQFNLNVLNVLNKKLGANFILDNFYHQAIYNDNKRQIEMYLVSKLDQKIKFPTLNETIYLKKDEKILTEISCKYTKADISRLLHKSGLQEQKHFEPANKYFSLVLAKRIS